MKDKPRQSQVRNYAADIPAVLLRNAAAGVVPLERRVLNLEHGASRHFARALSALQNEHGLNAFVTLCAELLGGRQDWRAVSVKIARRWEPVGLLIDFAAHKDTLAAARLIYPRATSVGAPVKRTKRAKIAYSPRGKLILTPRCTAPA